MSSSQTSDKAPICQSIYLGFWSQVQGQSFPFLHPTCSLPSPVYSECSLGLVFSDTHAVKIQDKCSVHLSYSFLKWMMSLRKEWQQCECEELGTCGFLLTPVPGKWKNHSLWGMLIHSRLLAHSLGESPFQEACISTPVPVPGEDGIGMCQTHVQLGRRPNIGSNLGISTSSCYFQFLASPCPSWGSPQLPQGLPGEPTVREACWAIQSQDHI